jgi:HK97 family phage major capsid protein
LLLSNELANDSDPDIAAQVGKSLANQISESLDSAFMANTTAKANNGLLSAAYTVVNAGTLLSNLDAWVDARFAAEAHGANVTAWVMHPSTARELSKLKTDNSVSNQSLLAIVADGLTIAGIPVLTSVHVDSDTVAWGLDATQLRYVLRQGTEVKRFDDITHDGQYVRGVCRAGWAFLNPAGIVRIVLSPLEYTVTLANGSSGETFTLKVNGVATGTIAYDATAATVKAALVAVDDGIEAADVTVTGSAGGPYTISLPRV